MRQMKSLNGYEIVDEVARDRIAHIPTPDVDKEYVDNTALEIKDWVSEGYSSIYHQHTNHTLEIVVEDGMATNNGDLNQVYPLSGAVYHGGIYDSYAIRYELTGQGTTIKIPRILPITRAEYDALEVKDETMIYLIKG